MLIPPLIVHQLRAGGAAARAAARTAARAGGGAHGGVPLWQPNRLCRAAASTTTAAAAPPSPASGDDELPVRFDDIAKAAFRLRGGVRVTLAVGETVILLRPPLP